MLRVKLSWGFSMNTSLAKGNESERIWNAVMDRCDQLFRRLQDAGVLRAEVDPVWTRRVYTAMIHEVCQDLSTTNSDPDTDALLRGVGGPTAQL